MPFCNSYLDPRLPLLQAVLNLLTLYPVFINNCSTCHAIYLATNHKYRVAKENGIGSRIAFVVAVELLRVIVPPPLLPGVIPVTTVLLLKLKYYHF
jgi:hypothetical protein